MLWIILGGVALLAAALLGVAYIIYQMAFGSPEHRRPDPYRQHVGHEYDPWRDSFDVWIRALDERPYEPVCILSSRDKTPLFARYYHVRDGAPVAIQMHGWRSCSIRDFCGGAPLAMDELGHNVLLVDQRAHGKSGGSTITFGILERYDCLDWVDYITNRFGSEVPILLYGISMGAATVLCTAALDLPSQVKGIFADCPYSRPWDILEKSCRDRHLPPSLCLPLLRLAARVFGGFSLSKDGPHPVGAVAQARIPILIIHGEADTFVPCRMSREIAAANPSAVQLETFEGGIHAGSYLVDPKRYREIIFDFMQRCHIPCKRDSEQVTERTNEL